MSSVLEEEGPFIGSMMRVCWEWVRQQIYSAVVRAGYTDLNPAHVALFRYPTPDGLHPSELAEQLQITKQSVNDLLGHLENLGYITREPDPADGRARVVRLTRKGRRLRQVIYREAQAAEGRVANLVGSKRFSEFRRTLEEITGRISDGSLNGSGDH